MIGNPCQHIAQIRLWIQSVEIISGKAQPNRAEFYKIRFSMSSSPVFRICVFGLLPVLACFSASARAQTDDKNQAKDPPSTITYTLDWQEAHPAHYRVKVDSTGHAAYESLPKADAEPDDMYKSEFVMSAELRDRIFALAEKANHFDGNFDFTKRKIAKTGTKTLEYAGSGKHFQTAYNWSENPAIQELTEIFYGISNTMEFGNKLAFMKRFDKLGLPEQLQSMLELRSEGHLLEIQTITPLLQKIAEDGSLMNLARQRARQLIQSQ